MKIVKTVENEKYNNAVKFARYDGNIFEGLNEWNDRAFFVTVYCKLEKGDDVDTLLDLIMDEYNVACRCIEEKKEKRTKIIIFEAESEEIENIRLFMSLIGKRVHNYNDDNYPVLSIG